MILLYPAQKRALPPRQDRSADDQRTIHFRSRFQDAVSLKPVRVLILTRAADYGAGLFVRSANLTITSCDFIGNSASEYGGAVIQDSGSMSVRDTLFDNNNAGIGAGAVGISSHHQEDWWVNA